MISLLNIICIVDFLKQFLLYFMFHNLIAAASISLLCYCVTKHLWEVCLFYCSNVLSKSLPATLPSHLYSRDESELEEPNYSVNSISKSRVEDESHHSRSMNRSNTSSERFQSPPFRRKLSVSARHESHAQSKNTTRNIVLLTFVIGILATLYMKFPNLIYLITKNNQDKSTQTVNHDKIIFENNMNNLQEKYNIDDNSILKLKTGKSSVKML